MYGSCFLALISFSNIQRFHNKTKGALNSLFFSLLFNWIYKLQFTYISFVCLYVFCVSVERFERIFAEGGGKRAAPFRIVDCLFKPINTRKSCRKPERIKIPNGLAWFGLASLGLAWIEEAQYQCLEPLVLVTLDWLPSCRFVLVTFPCFRLKMCLGHTRADAHALQSPKFNLNDSRNKVVIVEWRRMMMDKEKEE